MEESQIRVISMERGSVVIDLRLRSKKQAAPAAPAKTRGPLGMRISNGPLVVKKTPIFLFESSAGAASASSPGLARDLAAPKQPSRVISCGSNAKHASKSSNSFGTACRRLEGREYSDCDDVPEACLDTRTCFDLAKELRSSLSLSPFPSPCPPLPFPLSLVPSLSLRVCVCVTVQHAIENQELAFFSRQSSQFLFSPLSDRQAGGSVPIFDKELSWVTISYQIS